MARLCRADLLILLSDIDGLYDADPHKSQTAKLISRVTEVTAELRAMGGGSATWRGTGGMATKLNAAEIAMTAGVEMVITNGERMEDLYRIVDGEDVGTRFLSASRARPL
ncbi:Glutamate 5-kinase [bioreactor metagenome]|uniref:Glutamate 5-kinase n=1 Tax=bioreactor metagenome TaxID=1076179 RepID=A0A645JM96_9ZZZZ